MNSFTHQPYDLVPVNSYMALTHIKELTSSAAISSEFMITLYNTLLDRCNKGQATVFSYIPAPTQKEITQQVIGTGGYYFKLTTLKSGVDFIWHDRINNLFLFWGPSNYRVTRALNAIWTRISNKSLVNETVDASGEMDASGEIEVEDEDNFDYSDMPPLISYNDLM